jgi:hypothetical protein
MHIFHAFLCALLLTACATTQTAPPSLQGDFRIHQFNASGQIMHTYRVSTYSESEFPRRVSFTIDGNPVTLTGSYQIDEILQ